MSTEGTLSAIALGFDTLHKAHEASLGLRHAMLRRLRPLGQARLL